MPSHGHVAREAMLTQVPNHIAKAIDIELKDQREANENGIKLLCCSQDLLQVLFKVQSFHGIAMLPQDGRKIAEAEVSLVLKADQ